MVLLRPCPAFLLVVADVPWLKFDGGLFAAVLARLLSLPWIQTLRFLQPACGRRTRLVGLRRARSSRHSSCSCIGANRSIDSSTVLRLPSFQSAHAMALVNRIRLDLIACIFMGNDRFSDMTSCWRPSASSKYLLRPIVSNR